ncbi:MAG: hypothetical protein ACYDHH_07615 [Solirubrobacteraceae bacterium]
MPARPDPLDAKIARVAGRQQRNIARSQLNRIGATSQAVATRIKRGSLFRVYWGVFSVGAPAATPIERASAAVLACGERSALGLLSSLALWGFVKRWPTTPQVLTARRLRRKGIEVHHTTTLLQCEVTEHHGITTTTPARALLDCAPLLTQKRRERVINDALHTPFVRPHHLKAIAEKHPNHPGAPLLEPFWNTTDGPTRSGWEDDLKRFRADFNLHGMIIDTVVNGHEVDGWFPAERLIIQLDSWPSHRSEDRFLADREQDADNIEIDIETVRITYARFYKSREREAARVHRILARRRVYISLLSRA